MSNPPGWVYPELLSLDVSILNSVNITIVAHMNFDGANFLISCLAISDKCYFNNTTKEQKVDYLVKGLDLNKRLAHSSSRYKRWKDIGMYFPPYFLDKYRDLKGAEGKHIFFKVHHIPPSVDELNHLLKIIPYKKRVIYFKNSRVFSCLRNVFDNNGREIFDPDKIREVCEEFYYLNSLDFNKYSSLSKEKQDDIKSTYSSDLPDIEKIKNQYPENDFISWDVNWFLDEQQTLINIKKLYDVLGFDDYDEELISMIYRKWIDVMNMIKQSLMKPIKTNNKNETHEN